MNFDAKKIKLDVGHDLAGFTDAEGCFCVTFSPKRNENNEITSWKVKPVFTIAQKERHIVAQFKKHLKCGTVSTNEKTNVTTYTVSNLSSLSRTHCPLFQEIQFSVCKEEERSLKLGTSFKDFRRFNRDPSCPSKEDIERILALRVNTKAIVAKRIYSDEIILSSLEKTIHIDEIKQSSETNTPNSEELQGNVILSEMIESDLYGDIKN